MIVLVIVHQDHFQLYSCLTMQFFVNYIRLESVDKWLSCVPKHLTIFKWVVGLLGTVYFIPTFPLILFTYIIMCIINIISYLLLICEQKISHQLLLTSIHDSILIYSQSANKYSKHLLVS